MVATKRLKLALETDEKRKSRLEKMVATTQLRLALETEEERRAINGLDLIWIEIGFFFNSRNEPACPVMGTIFLVVINLMRGLYAICEALVARVYESHTNRALVHNYFIAGKYCVLSRYVAKNYINDFPANTIFYDAYQTISDI